MAEKDAFGFDFDQTITTIHTRGVFQGPIPPDNILRSNIKPGFKETIEALSEAGHPIFILTYANKNVVTAHFGAIWGEDGWQKYIPESQIIAGNSNDQKQRHFDYLSKHFDVTQLHFFDDDSKNNITAQNLGYPLLIDEGDNSPQASADKVKEKTFFTVHLLAYLKLKFPEVAGKVEKKLETLRAASSTPVHTPRELETFLQACTLSESDEDDSDSEPASETSSDPLCFEYQRSYRKMLDGLKDDKDKTPVSETNFAPAPK